METENIVAGWLKGSDSVNGYANPAGPLYTEGHEVTIAAVTNTDIALLTNCSSCTASRPVLCC
ncbi:DUF6229 family protein [Fulvimonas yonginensis]|uniref:DUF6229 family protein n=1 Tax=Fulvimonas yonginensis TaxID=1495200 RepID=A0ABU8JE18_9GAMM